MVGDRLNTDCLFGNMNGFQTLLVGTGVHKMSDVQDVKTRLNSGESSEELDKMIPDFYVSSLKQMFKK